MQYSNSLLVKINTKVYCRIFRPNMLKCFIPLGVNVSDAYWVFHIELIIICFTSFVTISLYRSRTIILHLRFFNFYANNLKSDNTCVKLCALLYLRGSRSEASNSLNFITNLYSLDKFNIVDISFMNRIKDVNSPRSDGHHLLNPMIARFWKPIGGMCLLVK